MGYTKYIPSQNTDNPKINTMTKHISVILTIVISMFFLGAGRMPACRTDRENIPASGFSQNTILTGADQVD